MNPTGRYGLAVLLAGGLAALAHATDEPNPFCHTMEVWIAQGGMKGGGGAAAGGCPIQGPCDEPDLRDIYQPDAATPIRWIRIYFNVFREDDGSNPAATPAQIENQIQRLSDNFAPWRIGFVADWRYVDDSIYRIIDGSSEATAMKETYAVDPVSQCNIFIAGYPGGFGAFPWFNTALTALGGIVLGDAYFGPEHDVLTHEMGHNLGLWHTHHGVNEVDECGACYEVPGFPSDVTGDFCSDTPPRPADFGLCGPPGTTDPCSGQGWGETQPENYMSYGTDTGDTCWTLFTPNQGARMHCWIEAELTSWYACEAGDDCNGNGVNDRCDIRDGDAEDANQNWIPDACEGVTGDLDGDGDVDPADLAILLGSWGACLACPADLDGDGIVGPADLAALLGSWG